jgi:enediyne biosynthesis protein E4
MNEPPSLLRNQSTSKNHWVRVALEGKRSNRAAIGARVTVHAGGATQTALVSSQSSYLSANDLRVHFGLGSVAAIDSIVVRWPSGERESFTGVKVNATAQLIEGKGR